MRILLISANTEQINMPVLPLGMACITSAVMDAGHEVKTMDMMGGQDFKALLSPVVESFDPEVVGISVRNIDDQCYESPHFLVEPVKTIVHHLKDQTKAPIVLGGAGYSIFPESVLSYSNADIGIRGEGETAFIELLERLEQNMDYADIPGIYIKGRPPVRQPVYEKSLDRFRLPRPSLLKVPSVYDKDEIFIPIQTRRGCPMHCTYCSTAAIEGGIVRKHSPETVLASLFEYVEAGYHKFFFVDNTFNLPPSYAEKLCDLIKDLNISWRCIIYPHQITETLARKMAEAGCFEISLGFESGAPSVLKQLNKRFTLEDIRRTSAIFKNHGIRQMGFLLLGGPGETRETVEESFAFIQSLEPDMVKLTVGIRIYPQTRLARMAVAEGRISSENDLLFPVFYIRKELEDWLIDLVGAKQKEQPNFFV